MSARAPRKVWVIPSLNDLVFLAILGTVLVGGSRMISGDGDPGRHLTVGSYILDTRSIPHEDIFSHTMAGQPFVPYEWLAEVSSALSYRAAGPAGPALLHGLVIAATFGIVAGHMRLRGTGPLLGVAVTLLAVGVSSIHWLARPHIFSFLGTAIFWAVLDLWRSGRISARWLWALPPTMLLWSNLHGGYLVGLILVGIVVGVDVLGLFHDTEPARRRLRQLAPVLAATIVGSLITPAGGSLLSHTTGYLGKKLLVDRTLEYMSPDFHEPASYLFLLMLLGTIAALAWSTRRPTLHEGTAVVMFTAFALYAARNIELFAIVVAPVLASELEALPAVGGRVADAVRGWLAERDRRTVQMEALLGGHVWPIVAFLGVGLAAVLQWQGGEPTPFGIRFDPRSQPVAAVEYLKQNPPTGNMFNELGWGGYLLHTMWPGQRVFIDGQTDFYGEPLVREYLQVVELRDDWPRVLDKYGVTWVVYETNSSLVRALTGTPEWQTIHQDALATVLQRVR